MDHVMYRTRLLQAECFDGDPYEFSLGEKTTFIRDMILGLIKEATEVLDEVPDWKWWVTYPGAIERDAYIEELVDVAHFTHALAQAVGCTDKEWREAYWRKHQIVRDRAANRKAAE